MATEDRDVEKNNRNMEHVANFSIDSNDFEMNDFDDNELDITENSNEKKSKAVKKNKGSKKVARDPNAPRQPMSGYLRFLNNRREKFRADHPGLSFSEVTRLMGAEWSQLPPTEKQMYLLEAEKDRERYSKELDEYQKSDTYKTFVHKQNKPNKTGSPNNKDKSSKAKAKLLNIPTDKCTAKLDENSDNFNIPIFTEKFLEHNKARESELRLLKRQNSELEEGNAVLSNHVDKLNDAVLKMESDIQRHRSNNESLDKHLKLLRTTLVKEFANVALPGLNEKLTEDNIDIYMKKLHSLVGKSSSRDDTSHHDLLVLRVRAIIQKLSFETS